MYLKLTERCNMTCKHCCMASTAKGRDMSREVAFAALQLAEDRGDDLTIGGGEPTLHPLFWDILGLALGRVAACDIPVLVVTNGSMTKDALRLADLARRGVISAALSQDSWHDPIDPKVVKAFTKEHRTVGYGERDNDYREIRTVERIIKSGRALKWGTDESCCCDTLFVEPDGKLWACGCRKESFGTVFAPAIPDDYNGIDCCTKEREKEKAKAREEALHEVAVPA